MPNLFKFTPLHNAAIEGLAEIIPALIVSGELVNARDDVGYTPLHLAAESRSYTPEGDCAAVIDALIRGGADVNARTDWSHTPLHLAVSVGDVEAVNALIRGGADVNMQDEGGDSALYQAKEEGHDDIVEVLKKAGAKAVHSGVEVII